ncbi:MAG: aminotransferase class I/II-fold pyridoxal phosphate-dependent enzyme [Phycisphaeraceae bacterium]|nr:aminotransferase class I/II-fold pyridoxal phosphate-dependent enzyme [Phycisphaerales bacterium]MCA9306653.1 aminotransferase class I/II-fold pyridoxal phosphate-dependent enzyme [Phycisphaerales bacterium]MCB9843542.1 aminotransferase class I/II-fold pyridoxal phosphate-dependent enzyme [Phycisphaeraceae bacterium]
MGHLSAPLGLDPDTLCAGLGIGGGDGEPLVTPLIQSTTFCRDKVGSNAPHQYSRVSNPTVAALERALGALENAPPAVAFATGLAAETALFLSLLNSGDHVVCGRTVYGGTTRLLQQLLPDFGITTTFVDSTDLHPVRLAIRPSTRLVFIETPANPTLDITDIRSVADIAHAAGALLAVDNTFLTPILQQPLDLGADISVYSTTKFIEGHSVALGGSLVSRDPTLLERFRFIRKCTGAIQTPFNAWLTLNGLKTLPLRLRRQSESAEIIARWLADRDEISRVYYPSLSICTSRSLIERQHLGFHGAVISFELTGGIESARRFAESLERCALVEHVGSVSTLITHPASMTHADISVDERLDVGITDGLLRLSIGLESPGAIIADLERALASVNVGRGEVLTCAATH